MSEGASAASMDPLKVPLPGRHVVEASAGTGKTFTIATLHLRFVVERGVPVGKVLVATFTDAATAELKDRLRQNLARAKRLVDGLIERTRGGGGNGASEGELDAADRFALGVLENADAAGDRFDPAAAAVALRRLEKALSAFDAAPVFTLHGFCQRLLTELAFESGARFEEELVIDAGPLLDAATAHFQAVAFGDPASPLAAATPTGKADWERVERAGRLGVEQPDAAVEPSPAALAAAEQELHSLGLAVQREWQERGEAITRRLRELAPGWHGRLGNRIDQRLDELAAAIGKAAWAELPEALCEPKLRRDVEAKAGGEHPEDPFFERVTYLRERATAKSTQPLVPALHAAATSARSFVAEAKRSAGTLTFDDLLRRVDEALRDPTRGPALVARVRARYPVAMIDEVQDTDPVQHRILEALFGGEVAGEGSPPRSFFSIGDPKQSIYRFRGADVRGFVRSREKAAPQRRHGLQQNFRTDAPLVAAAQAVFAAAKGSAFGDAGIDLPPVAAEHPLRSELSPAIEFAWVPVRRRLGKKGEPEAFPKSPPAQRAVAAATAADVAAVLAAGPRIGGPADGNGRRSAAGDLAVLCDTGRQLRAIDAALAERGVPAVRPGGSSVFASPEAATLRDSCVAWLEPSRQDRVRRAMLGPLLGVEPERLRDPEALTAAASLAAECGRRWRRRGFASAWAHAMQASGTVERLAGLPRGERAITNLLHLGELMQALADFGGLGPEALLARLRSILRRPSEADEAVGAEASAEIRLESDAAAVTLSTVHGSKGLEFPIVWLPFLWTTRRKQDAVKEPLHVRSGGAGAEAGIIDAGTDQLFDRMIRDWDDQRDEHRRLLYVALTRAKHQVRAPFTAVGGTRDTPLAGLIQAATGADLPGDAPGWRERLEKWAARVGDLASEDLASQGRDLPPAACIGVRDAPVAADASPPPATEATPAAGSRLAQRRLDRLPPPALASMSFSSMTAGDHEPHAAPAPAPGSEPEPADRDAGAATPFLDADAADVHAGPLDAMPGGTGVGSLVHAVLEDALAACKPGGPREPAEVCRERVEARAPAAGLPRAWHGPLADALAATLTRPIPLGRRTFALADTDPALRSIELPFVLRVGSREAVAAGRVAAALEASDHAATRETGRRLRRSGFQPFAGFLEGFVDLAVCADGVWHVVDHKSNRLFSPKEATSSGAAGGYGPEALEEVMVRSMYLLQGHLYLAAVHRLLGARAAGYNPAGQLGGMAYLFVRGIAGGPGAGGVYTHTPALAVIEELAEAFA